MDDCAVGVGGSVAGEAFEHVQEGDDGEEEDAGEVTPAAPGPDGEGQDGQGSKDDDEDVEVFEADGHGTRFSGMCRRALGA